MRQKIYNIGLHQIDFTQAFPLFDGKCLKKKDEWLRMLKWCLKECGYTFDFISRPVPPIMINWLYMDRKYLRKFLIRVLEQLDSIDSGILRLLILDIDGFCLRAPNGSSHKVVRLILTADGYRQELVTTVCLASKVCERFMNTAYKNKQILIN